MKLNPEDVSLDQLRQLWSGAEAQLGDASMQRVANAAASVDRIVASGETVYGVNTGFGMLANTRIPNERLAELQTNLILSHSAGLGDPLPRHVTRLMILLKLLGLGRGYSGVRPLVIDALQALLDRDALPVIPAQGSVGASGDLAPLAHLIAALMGHGSIDVGGDVLPAEAALQKLGMKPLQLGPKEGLALINGTQASTAIALDALFSGERVFAAAVAAGALSVDALKASVKPFDQRISEVRGQPGQIRVAAALRELLDGSEIVASHARCGRVQDPYSFRCQPQVMGAALDLLENAARTLTIEAGAVTDNPIVFPDEDAAISGGNFHAQPVAFAADTISIALCEVGSLSERRVAVLIDPKMSGLPPFLTEDFWSQLRADDPAGHRCRAGQREQVARFPGKRGHHSDLGGSGGPRLDGADRRPQGGADRTQRRRRDRGRVDRGRSGHRLPRVAENLTEAAGGACQSARTFAAPRLRQVLGRRAECASDGCARRRDRRPRILVVSFVAPVLLSRL